MPSRESSIPDFAVLQTDILAAEDRFREASEAGPEEVVLLFSDLLADDVIDVHASGWIYEKSQSIELKRNTASARATQREVVRTQTTEPKIVVLSADVVAVVSMKETYFAVPDPQSLAAAAGTMTMSACATRSAVAAAAAACQIGPGETEPPNPYRTRTTRVWARRADQWSLVLIQSSRITERVRI